MLMFVLSTILVSIPWFFQSILFTEERDVDPLENNKEVRNVVIVEDGESSRTEEFHLVSLPLAINSGNSPEQRRSRRRSKSETNSSQMGGELTIKLQNSSPQEGVAAINKLNSDGLVKEITTLMGSSQEVEAASAGKTAGVNSDTYKVFNEKNEFVLDDEHRPSAVQTQGSAVCEFCKAVGNVVCNLGCMVTTGLILASVSVSAPVGIAASTVVTAFCGLVTAYNDTVGKAGCGADWTVEQICAELYNNCENDDPVY